MTPPPSSKQMFVVNLSFMSLVGLWLFLAFYVVHAALPHNSVRLPFEGQLHAYVITPEGWGFFTGNPRQDRAYFFWKGRNGWTSAARGPDGRASNLFGLSRNARGQGVEFASLLSQLPRGSLQTCQGDPLSCLSRITRPIAVKNPLFYKTLCGEVGLVTQPPIPWAWRRSKEKIVMPSQVVLLDVSCP